MFAGNDQSALGLLGGLWRAGRSVPGDVSVVGFDDVPEAAHLVPALTTVRQDFAALGRRALDVLLVRLAGGRPEHQPLAPRLVVRASTGPPPGGRPPGPPPG